MNDKDDELWVWRALWLKITEIAVLLGFHYGLGMGWIASFVLTVVVFIVLVAVGLVVVKRNLR